MKKLLILLLCLILAALPACTGRTEPSPGSPAADKGGYPDSTVYYKGTLYTFVRLTEAPPSDAVLLGKIKSLVKSGGKPDQDLEASGSKIGLHVYGKTPSPDALYVKRTESEWQEYRALDPEPTEPTSLGVTNYPWGLYPQSMLFYHGKLYEYMVSTDQIPENAEKIGEIRAVIRRAEDAVNDLEATNSEVGLPVYRAEGPDVSFRYYAHIQYPGELLYVKRAEDSWQIYMHREAEEDEAGAAKSAADGG